MIRIAVVGVSGRMGLCLVKAAELSENTKLTVAVSRPESGNQASQLRDSRTEFQAPGHEQEPGREGS